jgi:hypothetical protein
MRCSLFAICIVLLLIARLPSYADDWDQVGGGDRGGTKAAAPATSVTDRDAISNFVALSGAPKPCEIIGSMANSVGANRDQGLGQDELLATLDHNLTLSAEDHHWPQVWRETLTEVVHREVAYAYEHPRMSAEQIKADWENKCQAQAGM